MPFLQSSGAISIGDLNNFFPGSGTAMSNFYRGGGRVPIIKTVIVRDPSSGFYNGLSNATAYWSWYAGGNYLNLRFNSTLILNQGGFGSSAATLTSYTYGGFTYLRGSVVFDDTGYGGSGSMFYSIARESTGGVSINTGVPSSGTISLSQFYGAEKQ